MTDKKKKLTVPDSYVILFFLIALVCILTHFIPAGKYDLIEGSKAVNPESFHFVDAHPAGFLDFLSSFMAGAKSASDTIFAYLTIGGAFGVLTASGAIHAAINLIIRKTKGNYRMIVPAFMIIMSIIGMLGTGNNITVAFAPIMITVASRLGLDAVAIAAMIFVGSNMGFATSPMNPFTVLIAQNIAGIPSMSGFMVRFVWWVVCTVISIFYVLHYCKKIKEDPSRSIVGISREIELETKDVGITGTQILNLIVMALTFAVYAWGGITHSWALGQLGTCMVVMAICCGIVSRMTPNELARQFKKGAASVTGAALIVGMASSISVIMTNANIIHSVVYYLTLPLRTLPHAISACGMFVINFLVNFPINSGSAQAYAVMPIMAPAADVLGISRQLAVYAYQFGDGMCNMLTPTNGLLLGTIAACGVSYSDWLKFIWKFIIIISLACMCFLIGAALIGWS